MADLAAIVARVLAPPVQIRPAEPSDVEWIHSMVIELATYERAAGKVVGTTELLASALFGPEPSAEALVAQLDDEPAGFALYYMTFSTWEARPGIWLEDLYVRQELRRAGVGQALLQALASITVNRGYSRLEWAALDWNEPALRFYQRLGAEQLDEWVMHRLDGEPLRRVAGGGNAGELLSSEGQSATNS